MKQLYDQSSDPGEFHNLYGTAGHEAITKRLASQLSAELGPHQVASSKSKKTRSLKP